MTGQIFNIQKYALHDGPGIRTTIFFKGCPLSCEWCHNPESIRQEDELIFNASKCIKCDHCSDFTIAEPCPTLALEAVGKSYTVTEIMDEILKDVVFYDQSGGGVTFSGGEPLMQHEFLLDVLKDCKKHDIHTTIDTTGFSNWNHIEKLLPYVDLFLFDIKHLDSDRHKALTGVPNELILDNFKKIIQSNDVYIRVPLIKSFNDQMENIKTIIAFAKSKHVLQINFLPYHAYASNKYDHLVNKLQFKSFDKPDQAFIDLVLKECEENNVTAYIGG